jgi:hypothetical protein
MGVKQEVRDALYSILGGGGTALGYDFVSNPQGFILAVLWDEAVTAMQNFANGVAARFYGLWILFDDVVVGGVAHALGTPARAFRWAVTGALIELDRAAFVLALQLGPLGFLATPIVWGVTLVVAVVAAAAVWKLYKWIRVVVV